MRNCTNLTNASFQDGAEGGLLHLRLDLEVLEEHAQHLDLVVLRDESVRLRQMFVAGPGQLQEGIALLMGVVLTGAEDLEGLQKEVNLSFGLDLDSLLKGLFETGLPVSHC